MGKGSSQTLFIAKNAFYPKKKHKLQFSTLSLSFFPPLSINRAPGKQLDYHSEWRCPLRRDELLRFSRAGGMDERGFLVKKRRQEHTTPLLGGGILCCLYRARPPLTVSRLGFFTFFYEHNQNKSLTLCFSLLSDNYLSCFFIQFPSFASNFLALTKHIEHPRYCVMTTVNSFEEHRSCSFRNIKLRIPV